MTMINTMHLLCFHNGTEYLYFGSTSFTYSNGVPDFLSNLTNLAEFDCSYTYFTGPLRSTPFETLSQLTYIELDGNAYNSSIPTIFGSLPSLTNFYAANAFVSGDLSFMKGMPSIYELWVDQNSIGGSLPTFLGSLSTLSSFSVTRNELTGSFPTEISQLSNMIQMWYYTNQLSGPFPDYSALTVMITFKLEDNFVTGNANSLCTALGPPFGVLKILGVDCNGTDPLVTLSASCTIRCCTLSDCGDP